MFVKFKTDKNIANFTKSTKRSNVLKKDQNEEKILCVLKTSTIDCFTIVLVTSACSQQARNETSNKVFKISNDNFEYNLFVFNGSLASSLSIKQIKENLTFKEEFLKKNKY